MSARGFTTIELLVAAALVLVLAAALGGLAQGMQRAFDGSVASVDLTGRARAGLAAVTADLHAAGSGLTIGASLQGLPDLTPIVIPRRSFDDGALAGPFEGITIVRATGAQSILRDRVPAGTVLVQLDPAAPSARQDGTAGLARGDAALLFDTTRVETVVVDRVDSFSWTVTLNAPVRYAFEPGAAIAGIERTTYGLRRDVAGNSRLVRRTTGGAEQPIVDHVTRFEVLLWGLAEPPAPGAVPTWFPSYGPAPPPLGVDDDRDVWPPGENCTLTVDSVGVRLARLTQLGAAGALVPLTPTILSDGPWCPDPTDPEAFDADLLRVRRVDVRLRVESEPAGVAATPPLSISASTSLRQR